MKRRELIKKIEEEGAVLVRHDGKHDWYQDPRTKLCQPVPRHNEIKEYLARHNPAKAFVEAIAMTLSSDPEA